MIKENLIEVFSQWKYASGALVTGSLLSIIFYLLTDWQIIFSYQVFYLWALISLQIIIIVLFGLFFPITIYKYVKFSSISVKENSSSLVGTFLGYLITGCPTCTFTLASFLGLASIISLLPWYGLELKIIAVPMLVYANYSTLKNLQVCKTKIEDKYKDQSKK